MEFLAWRAAAAFFLVQLNSYAKIFEKSKLEHFASIPFRIFLLTILTNRALGRKGEKKLYVGLTVDLDDGYSR